MADKEFDHLAELKGLLASALAAAAEAEARDRAPLLRVARDVLADIRASDPSEAHVDAVTRHRSVLGDVQARISADSGHPNRLRGH